MTIETAERIINDYGKVLSHSVPPRVFQPNSNLPCSTARIKFAIYRYVIELLRIGHLNKDTAEMLIIGYSSLSYFVQGQPLADALNQAGELKDDKHPDTQVKIKRLQDQIHALALQKDILTNEIQEFIKECIMQRHG
ncbi:MAG: hypothetical protein IAE67_10230 [Candidatus Competibacteraceae bacterium]|nr:hypothetical protein [Candidatus Competibacteraceae bacterium]